MHETCEGRKTVPQAMGGIEQLALSHYARTTAPLPLLRRHSNSAKILPLSQKQHAQHLEDSLGGNHPTLSTGPWP
jgi:hypothetical protein